MEDHEQSAASHGSGMQIALRHLEYAKAASSTDEKVARLTDAVEALLLHLRHTEDEATLADLRRGSDGVGSVSGGSSGGN